MKHARAAFSLLELMLALSLLAALMAVAWSLLGTYRDAELRGWRLSHRTMTIRSARAWIEKDVDHFESQETSFSAIEFMGDALGFSATISPSIDPLPFLEQIMPGSMPEVMLPESTGLQHDIDDLEDQGLSQDAMWPSDSHRVEYRLAAMPSNPSLDSIPEVTSEDQQFELIRREWTSGSSGDLAYASGYGAVRGAAFGADKALPSAANEKVLNAVDLYRQSDHSDLGSAAPSRETKLYGLCKARFHYFDGNAWKRDWNSATSGGLPAAIALGFDFPATSQIKKSNPTPAPSDPIEALAGDGLNDELSFAESATVSDTIADQASSASQSSLTESGTNAIQIVVHLGKNAPRSFPFAAQPLQPGVP